MAKWLERAICILVGVCIAMLILSFKDTHKPNTKENHRKRNVEYTLIDLENVLEGNCKTIDDRIKKYVKRHQQEKITESKIKEILGDAYSVLKEKNVEKVAVELVADDINEVYTATYTLKIAEELYELDMEVKLNEESKIENIRFVDFISISK